MWGKDFYIEQPFPKRVFLNKTETMRWAVRNDVGKSIHLLVAMMCWSPPLILKNQLSCSANSCIWLCCMSQPKDHLRPTEVIGRRAFHSRPSTTIGLKSLLERCFKIPTIMFQEPTRLQRIGEGVFAVSGLKST
jgi:hypothetical protein